jgi:hypothetical protein
MRRNSRQNWQWSWLSRCSVWMYEHCWTPTAARVTTSTCLWLRTGWSHRLRERTHLFRSQRARSTSYLPRSLTRTRGNDPYRSAALCGRLGRARSRRVIRSRPACGRSPILCSRRLKVSLLESEHSRRSRSSDSVEDQAGWPVGQTNSLITNGSNDRALLGRVLRSGLRAADESEVAPYVISLPFAFVITLQCGGPSGHARGCPYFDAC